jgi:hypothetical protein
VGSPILTRIPHGMLGPSAVCSELLGIRLLKLSAHTNLRCVYILQNEDRIIQLYIQCHSINVYFLQLPSVVTPQTAKYTLFIQGTEVYFSVVCSE